MTTAPQQSTAIELRASGSNLQVGAGQMQAAEFAAIEMQANALAGSTIVPRAFKGKPADIVAVASIGREVGLSVMASMQSIHLIEGKPTMSAQLMGALVRARGHSLAIERLDDDGVKLIGVRADTGDRMEYEFTKAHAQAAQLMGKGVWKAHFRAMALARCTSQIARNLFPDVLAGISYTPEEGADIAGVDVRVDPEGEVVEIGEVRVANRTAPPAPAAAQPAPDVIGADQPDDAPATELADPSERGRLTARLQELDEAQRQEFAGWNRAQQISWKADAMTVDMAHRVEAKLDEILTPDEAVEGELEEPADDLASLTADVDAAQTTPEVSQRRRSPTTA